MRNRCLRYFLASVFIALGLAVMAIPFVTEKISAQRQAELLEEYKRISEENLVLGEEPVSGLEERESLNHNDWDNELQTGESGQSSNISKSKKKETLPSQSAENSGIKTGTDKVAAKKKKRKLNPVGILMIDSIEFDQIIMPTASKEDLSISVGWIPQTGWLNSGGNICIAGHRSKASGRNFNKLDEVKLNDVLRIETIESKKEYLVAEKFIVKPEEVWVVAPFSDKETLTLITCTPIDNPTHRLIIRAVEKDG